ncbi:glycosyltransferase family 4 protein [Eubacterium callanderi]|uniref:glycosyltransferase family 4 protein n=1 Tax=Eubacterium callanderi TaxID=53442 RepID=UPI001C10204A|nr:glycosyltransferase family 4 protein [Eubacterium callanderi]MBU5304844.1 glycosyltransferase family 4 protein [Eubacterium callanderi]WPK68989.1 N,N'-diacetylbacillosaminyl-diphospho-undecaprenol alpha-1,3-N-acetylgalactosaminyltransferase [Eubacterium callanderi]WPK73287.1 N,N'-diacetylbacillosaminyl-diphospho-undecaprenol alpha-1,3-N-acetylgalactosaminyltransferase [Eubacterium callanderi]
MKIAIMCNTHSSEYPNRPELIDALLECGDDVYFAAIYDGIINSYYSKGKAKYLSVLASRNNTNPFVEIKSLWNVRKEIKDNGIESVIIYGIKNHPAMAIGAWLGGTRNIVCIVNGRGNLFTVKGFKGTILRFISFPMLKIAYRVSKTVCFQNEDDSAFFAKKRLVKKTKISHIDGSGVNTDIFKCYDLPKENEFLYLARITPSKGLVEYIEAARLVKKKYPSVKFHVVGPIDNAVEPSINNYLDSAVADGSILYHGKTDDVQGWLSKSRFFIYPSYYPEGVPRCVLQALSCGRPIITCDSPGCKKTVVDGVNGFLTKPRDYMEIAKKIVVLLKDPILAENMGKESRKLAEEKFDIGIINKKTISLAHGEKC